MRYLKLTKGQRNIKHKREKRNHIICETLALFYEFLAIEKIL